MPFTRCGWPRTLSNQMSAAQIHRPRGTVSTSAALLCSTNWSRPLRRGCESRGNGVMSAMGQAIARSFQRSDALALVRGGDRGSVANGQATARASSTRGFVVVLLCARRSHGRRPLTLGATIGPGGILADAFNIGTVPRLLLIAGGILCATAADAPGWSRFRGPNGLASRNHARADHIRSVEESAVASAIAAGTRRRLHGDRIYLTAFRGDAPLTWVDRGRGGSSGSAPPCSTKSSTSATTRRRPVPPSTTPGCMCSFPTTA